ncbi:uncharacterized protein Z518_07697 [Rhinocladiella mackenziei CBS 650.93]|uniref:F-box domain-containing protein n=1 Tax=Rhinocladiella mackenziei CBS 650.93 TaxID=1442369 RepID=A0A0D2H114_9EURO|nr:uncharacterized protein Z518_07697 [Rhinocladiella mackenziei CBS 650.93]KIX04143.1 hypothetical protein Z518_07697 [Rhinocladiella mackenziei CBS 650.93]
MTLSTSSSPISTLPPELLHHILVTLPISSLVKFGRTSKPNYSAAMLALQNLQLAIFPRKVHATLAFLNSPTFEDTDATYGEPDYNSPPLNQITIPAPLPVPLTGSRKSKSYSNGQSALNPAQHRQQLFHLQNALACSVLSTPSLAHLLSLTLHTYHIISPSLMEILATHFPKLRHLHLNSRHPYVHDASLPAHYWTSPLFLQGSPIWNALAGIGQRYESKLRLRNLERLTVERAGITSVQLRKWLERNPGLRELTLRNVSGVELDFVEWLGAYHDGAKEDVCSGHERSPAKLKTLVLEECSSLSLRIPAEFRWLDSLFHTTTRNVSDDRILEQTASPSHRGLQVLSLQGSRSVSTPSLLMYLETMRPAVRQITLPDGCVLVAQTSSQPQPQSQSSTALSLLSQACANDFEANQQALSLSGSGSSSDVMSAQPDATSNFSNIGHKPGIEIQPAPFPDANRNGHDDPDHDEKFPSPVSYLRNTTRAKQYTLSEYKPGRGGFIEPDTRW